MDDHSTPRLTDAERLDWLRLLNAPLQAIVHGGSGPPSVVLLHGYGSRAEDWLQFEPKLLLPGNTQLIYPPADGTAEALLERSSTDLAARVGRLDGKAA